MMQAWQPFNETQQRIAVFPPPMYTPDFAEKATHTIQSLGAAAFVPSHAKNRPQNYHGWHGSPIEKAADIMEVLREPNIGAIFSFGGSGTVEVVQILKKYYLEEIREIASAVVSGKRPAPALFGFSDATNLLHFLGQEGVVSPVIFSTEIAKVNGSNLPEAQDLSSHEENELMAIRQAVVQFLKEPSVQSSALRPLNQAAANERTIHGGLTVYNEHNFFSDVGATMGGRYSNILLLEAGHEGKNLAQGLREKLSQLKTYNKLSELEAIIVSQCDANGNAAQAVKTANIKALQDVVAQEVGNAIPVLFGAPFGHPAKGALLHSRPLPLHTDSLLSLGGDDAVLNVAPIRSLASVQNVAEQFMNAQTPKTLRSEKRGAYPKIFIDQADFIPTPILGSLLENRFSQDNMMVCAVDMSKSLVRGAELTALKNGGVSGKNIIIHMPLPEVPDGCAPDFWETLPAEQKDGYYSGNLQLAMTELVMSGALHGVNSITFSTNEPLPEISRRWLEDFAFVHLPGVAVSTAQIPEHISQQFPDKALAHVSFQKEPGQQPHDWVSRVKSFGAGLVCNSFHLP